MWSRQQASQRVRDVLETWNEEEAVVCAGVLHRAYLPCADGPPLFSFDERDLVRALAGERAERLAYRSSFVRIDELTERDGDDDVRDLAAIALASLAALRCQGGGAPAPWLADAARLARLTWARAVPVFADGETVEEADETALLAAYRAMWETPLAADAAPQVAALAARIPVAEPLIVLGLRALVAGEDELANDYATRAQTRLLQWNAAWDKRLPEVSWLALTIFLAQALEVPPPERAFIAGTLRELFAVGSLAPEVLAVRLAALDLLPTPVPEPPDASPAVLLSDAESDAIFDDDDLNEIPARFTEYLDGLLEDDPQRALSFYPGLRSQPWWDPQEFPLVRALEAAAAEIAAEFGALDPLAFHAERERIRREGSWDVFLLFERGRKRDERCALVPTTTRIIEEHSTLRTQAGLVYFSRLAPGSIVAPHRGPTNVRLRCHLGLSVPGNCGISVDNVTKTWQAGKCIVFDDSFTHSVWNSSDQERVVLIVDVWHPDLGGEERDLLAGLHRYGSSMAENLSKYWRKNDEALVAAG
jgi:aspartate beta-hydroxylase